MDIFIEYLNSYTFLCAINFIIKIKYCRYINGDIYEGYFKDGLPHGHGVKKEGHFMASVATVYVGEWMHGVKNGYGVMDNILSGKNFFVYVKKK